MDALKEDLDKLDAQYNKSCKEFLIFLNKEYVPDDKKLDLKDELLKENSLKKTMLKMFLPIFHPDKNMAEERKIQVLREEITKHLNNFVEQFKNKVE